MEVPTFEQIHKIYNQYCSFLESDRQLRPQRCLNLLAEGIAQLHALNDTTHHLDNPDHTPSWIYCFLEVKINEAIEQIPEIIELIKRQETTEQKI